MHEDFRRAVDSKDVNVVPIGDTLVPDVIDFLRAQVIWIVVALIVGGVIGAGLAMTKPKLWEATSMVQVGQVGYVDPPGSVGVIETVQNAVERITGLVKQGPDDQLFKSGQISARDISMVRSTFSAQPVPNTGFIRMTVRGTSPDEAANAIRLVENQLISVHAKMVDPSIARLKDAAARAAVSLDDVSKRRADLQAQAQASAGKQATAQDVLLSTLLDKVDTEYRDLETRRAQLAEQLSEERTFPTRPIGDVSVSPGPVAPKVSYYVIGGLFIGAFVGFLIGLVRHFARPARRP
jgi:hypothetical protein